VINRLITGLTEMGLLRSSLHLDMLRTLSGKVQTDNRLLQPGDIFVCIRGGQFDGHRFVASALEQRAALIISMEEPQSAYPCLVVTDTRKAAAIIARELYLPEGQPFTLTGITGTNGKTTTSLLLFEALSKLGHKCGWIGTLGYYIGEQKFPTMHTTPDIIQLNEIFAQMAAKKVTHVVMEVSSHALALDRVYGVTFNYCLFSNLSRDHLDFHGDMQEYGEAKMLLFKDGLQSGATAVVNTDDEFGKSIAAMLHDAGGDCSTVGSSNADYQISNVNTQIDHSNFSLAYRDGELAISSDLIGSFNISNLALAAATLHRMNFSVAAIEAVVRQLSPVKGRIEKVPNRHGIGVFVDYAHTPDAIENVLKSLISLPHGRLLCLIGAGGDRDKGKRPLMLKAALKHSDAVIITDDNPRNENPESIIRDIVNESDLRLPWWIIRDRRTAIRAIITLARPGDIVVLCGKGHENYQEIEGIRHHFDDVEEAGQALEVWTSSITKADDELLLPLDICLVKVLFGIHFNDQGSYISPRSFRYLSTDTRTLKTESIFVAIKGPNFNGQVFISRVMEDNSNLVITEDIPDASIDPSNTDRMVVVPDVMEAMGSICRKYLQMFHLQKIALTGSTGKTSTKEYIARVLESQARTLKTEANENNMVGLCKTILRVLPEHEYAVFELGTNHFGEIASLADVCEPDIGMLLNVGPSHLEYFGDENGVLKEKTQLLLRPLAHRFYSGDDPRFAGLFPDAITVGYSEQSTFRITDQVSHTDSQSFMLADQEWHLPQGAPHQAVNAAYAIALALTLGFSPVDIQTALSTPVNLAMRSQTDPRGSGILISDCYNANPYSMQKALEYWSKLLPDQPHYAILGDMLELGTQAEMYHRMIAAILLDMQYEKLITVGEWGRLYHNPEELQPLAFDNVELLLDSSIIISIPQNAVILVKASHGMHLERLLPLLKGGS